MPQDAKSKLAWLASRPEAERRSFLGDLSGNALAAMPYLWELWANPQHQQEPEGDWQIWVIMGGRGAGKTRAGAEWVRAQVEGATPRAPGRCRRVCLLGETIDQTRAVMVEGDSGILAVSPPDRRPELKISQSKLVWPNGAEAMLASAANPEALRGPQFDCAWSDELAKWRYCREAWDMLQFCLRLGDRTRQLVTTTPRNNEVLLEILESPFTAVTRAPTSANLANLAPDFLARLEERYGGTSLGRQELEGELIRDAEGALWTRELVETARIDAVPELDRVVVAVDPPVTGNAASDECGIVVAGCAPSPEGRLHAYVLADYSIAGGPTAWAEMALEAYREHRADRLVAEVNQGGELIETVIREIDPDVSYRAVRATQGKRVRAEPVAALYEQGRVHHLAGLAALEDQMCRFTAKGVGGIKSPDRLDALVWALTDLVLDRPRAPRPGVRTL